MKYIKEYKEFDNKMSIDIDDIRDILLDLEDSGFLTDVRKDHNHSYDSSSGEYKELDRRVVTDNIRVRVGKSGMVKDPKYKFNTDEIKECVNRVFDYIKGKGINIKKEFIISPFEGESVIDAKEFPNNLEVEFVIIDIWIIKNKKWWKIWK